MQWNVVRKCFNSEEVIVMKINNKEMMGTTNFAFKL